MSKTKQKRWRWQHTRHLQFIYLLIMAIAIIVPATISKCQTTLTVTRTRTATATAPAPASTARANVVFNKTLKQTLKYSTIKTNRTKMSISVNETLNNSVQMKKQNQQAILKKITNTTNPNNRPVNTANLNRVNKINTSVNVLKIANKNDLQHQFAFKNYIKAKAKSTSPPASASASLHLSLFEKINDNHFTSFAFRTTPATLKHSTTAPSFAVYKRKRRFFKQTLYPSSSTSLINISTTSLPFSSLGLWQQQYLKVNQVFENERVASRNSNFQQNRGKIVLLGLFELSTKMGPRPEGLSELIAAQMAVEHINRKKLLPGYTLELLTNDTQVGVLIHFIYMLI